MTANYKEMTKEQMRAHMKAFMERAEQEAREWVAQDNRRMKESLKQKLERDRKNSKNKEP
jgi:hypothetical protein